jgi:hypothetical protein
MMSIHQANLGALSGGIKPNCGPTAVANLMGWKTSAVMGIFRKEFDYGPRWQGRSYLSQCVKVLKWQRMMPKTMGNERGRLSRKMSLKNFVEMHCKQQGRYLIRVGGHIVAVIDQVVYDQHEIAPIAESKCARKMVSHAFEIK